MRRSLLVALALVTPLGFATKFYAGPGVGWIGPYAGGLLYEIFWILAIALVWPRLSPARIALGVFLATCFLEVLQLWRPPPLEALRSTFLGRALVGSTFSWWDFPHYVGGAAAGFGLLRALTARVDATDRDPKRYSGPATGG